jgi:hypothetical protein
MKNEPNAIASESPGKDVQGDFAQFTDFMRRLVKVPPEVVRERLKAAKKPRVSSVSRVPASDKTTR